MSRVLIEPPATIVARRQLTAEEWQAAIDEKLRRRDFELAGFEPLPGISLALARQIEEGKP